MRRPTSCPSQSITARTAARADTRAPPPARRPARCCGGDSGWGWGLGLWGGDRDGPSTGADKAARGARGPSRERWRRSSRQAIRWCFPPCGGTTSMRSALAPSPSFWMARSSSAAEDCVEQSSGRRQRQSEEQVGRRRRARRLNFHALRLRLAREAEAVVGEVRSAQRPRSSFG